MNKRHWETIAKHERANKTDMLKEIRDGAAYLEQYYVKQETKIPLLPTDFLLVATKE
jgi:hypothetical protein